MMPKRGWMFIVVFGIVMIPVVALLVDISNPFGSMVMATISGKFFGGLSDRKDYDLLLRKANEGDVNAQLGMGWLYEAGRLVPKSYVEASEWYYLAARQGSSIAQYKLGYLYESGQGVPMDTIEAYRWYSLSAGQDFRSKEQMIVLGKSMTPEQIAEAKRRAAQK